MSAKFMGFVQSIAKVSTQFSTPRLPIKPDKSPKSQCHAMAGAAWATPLIEKETLFSALYLLDYPFRVEV
jgi:hypothetical protein